MLIRLTSFALITMLVGSSSALSQPSDRVAFETSRLAAEFYCEGATYGDLDRDGHPDLVAGPFWFRGPEFTERRELYAPKPFDAKTYSDNFFAFVFDFSKDDFLDVLFVGFPGKTVAWLENPGRSGAPWRPHVVFEGVDNESPTFEDLTGDGRPELVCMHGGAFGFVEPNENDPRRPWTFQAISEGGHGGAFTHGLGVGDLTGDGRPDLLWKGGVFEQPERSVPSSKWRHHPFRFSEPGGAQMLVFDVDGDGDADVVTSLHAHGYGLAWFELTSLHPSLSFKRHDIMGGTPSENPYGARIGNLHALALADINRDGLQDVVTGNRYWAHSGRDTSDQDVPEIAWFGLERRPSGPVFVPHTIHPDSGVGTQVVVGDVTGDGLPDVVVGNKKGIWLHRQRAKEPPGGTDIVVVGVPAASPEEGFLPKRADGTPMNLDLETGDLRDWKPTGAAFRSQPTRGDTVLPRRADMKSRHQGQYWVGTYEVDKNDRATGTLSSEPFLVTHPFASFLVGGGAGFDVGVDLVSVDSGAVLFSARGSDEEDLDRVVVDLSDHQGKAVFLRIVDAATGHWGHINYDDFRFHPSRPKFEPRRQPTSVQTSGYSADVAAKRMTVPQGFHVDVIASEPRLHQPIAFCFDGRGRLWIAEAYAYPLRQKEGLGRDRVLVLEDRNHDGSFESSTVFMDKLNLVSGLAVGFGGVWIGAAPELLFIPDRNRDLVPDGPAEVVLDGFGFQDTHETLNAFLFGPDGWLYGCHGVFTHSLVGAPGTKKEDRVPMNAAVWRLHPTRRSFEVFAEGASNQWGVDFDDRGQAFITACVIPHLFHIVQGGRFERQAGEHFNPYIFEDIKTIADHRHYLGATPHGGNGVSADAGGGHAHCGAMIYLSDVFPATWRGRIFMSNIHGNRFNTDRLERSGSGFVGRHGEDFLLSNDQWFRGINMKTGPDGQVYLIDWYDRQACHRTVPEIWDRSNGRLYRVRYGEVSGFNVDLDSAKTEELIDYQLSAKEWFAREARRVLQERGPDVRVHARLVEMIRTLTAPIPRLRCLWTLHVTLGLSPERVEMFLKDEDETVRAWTVQLAAEHPESAALHAANFARLAESESSPVVRLYLASALQRLSDSARIPVAAALLNQEVDEKDHNLSALLWYGVSGVAEKSPRTALELARTSKCDRVRRFVWRQLAAQSAESRDLVLSTLSSPEIQELRSRVLAEILEGMKKATSVGPSQAWVSVSDRLLNDADPRVSEPALRVAARLGDVRVLPELRALTKNREVAVERRIEALEALERAKDPLLTDVLLSIIDDALLRTKALKSLASVMDPRIAPTIVKGFPGYSTEDQVVAAATLASRPETARVLLESVESGALHREILNSAILRRQLSRIGDDGVKALLQRVWGQIKAPDQNKERAIAAAQKTWNEAALARADLPHGRAIYAKTCMNCHRLFDVGRDVGPDLSGSNRRDLTYLLTNILDPSAEVAREYRVTTLWMADGRILDGIVATENEEAITMKLANETVTVRKAEIAKEADGTASRKDSALSMMPDDQLQSLKPEEIRDLLAYLRSDVQVPLRAEDTQPWRIFNGTDLSLWDADPAVFSVENGELVGRTPTGLARNVFARSHLLLRDFRLVVDVKLVRDQGNSGIQMRSEVLSDGDVKGLQADIGKGYWGDLYEEHGRGLRAKAPAALRIPEGEWVTYEIVAAGQRILTALNGQRFVDVVDPLFAREGVVALQVHSGGPTEIRFRNFRLELNPEVKLSTLK